VVTIQVTPAAGAAPLSVAFTATGEAATYRWDFGDGSSADGRAAAHTYAEGRWTATLTRGSSCARGNCCPEGAGTRIRPIDSWKTHTDGLFPIAMGLGFGIGYGLDKLFHTWPWLTIIFSVFGTIAAFINLFRIGTEKNGP